MIAHATAALGADLTLRLGMVAQNHDPSIQERL